MNDAAQGNQYKYNGKELNGDFGLNWMDYGARWYDGTLGRWWSVDPIVNLFPFINPYNYVDNTPIISIDPDGRSQIISVTLKNNIDKNYWYWDVQQGSACRQRIKPNIT